MIARNAEQTVGRALESVAPFVDHIVVVLAGQSTDGTADAILTANTADATLQVEHFLPADNPNAFFPDGALSDFAAARNETLKYVPKGSHWMFIDADDELVADENGVSEALKALEDGAGVVALRYDYTHDEYGVPCLVQNKERFYSGRITDWRWQDRVHEWCKSEQDAPYARLTMPFVKHDRQPDDIRTQRNRRILTLMLEEDESNRRARLHLADSYYATQEWEQALDLYVRSHADPEIEPHAYYCALQAAKCAIELGDINAAAQWSMVAIDMRPLFKDGYLLRARVAADMEDWETALLWLDNASDKHENTNDTMISVWVADYKWNAWNVQYRALYHLKRFQEAIAVATLALKEYPDSAHWTRERHIAEEAHRIEMSVQSIGQLADHFCRRGDTLNAWKLVQDQNLPMTIRQDERIHALRARIFSFVKHVWDPTEYQTFYSKEVPGHEINGTSIDRYRLEPVLRELERRGAKRVLEVGTGAGGPAIWMLRQLPDVEEYIGLDINPDLVDLANAAAEFHGLSDRLKFEVGTLADYSANHPQDRGSMGAPGGRKAGFDAVLLLEIIEHVAPQDAYNMVTMAEEMGECVMGTTPGMFCGDIPSLSTDGYPRDHVKEWSLSDLEQMIYKVPRRRPVNIHKVYAPEKDPEWLHITPDGETSEPLVYAYPGFASWFFEFDHVSRHQGPVCIYTGAGPGWSPLDLAEKGLGGAETMAVKMAEQFAKNNHPVCVYGDWTGVFNGVIYRHWSSFNPAKPYLGVDAWLFIASRIPGVFDDHINADIKWLWEHDVDAGSAELTEQRLEQIDRILVLSEWHKQHWLDVYPHTPTEKLVVTRNAIDPADFPIDRPEKVRHRFIWPSSPDRGLDLVLDWWPQVREQWPDAELHIFYGWDTVDFLSKLPGREWLPLFKQKIFRMANQPGVFMRGRVNQAELHAEMAKAQFWLYPSKTAFEWAWNETYCIAAVEAMAMGVQPVVADTGALRERLKEFGLADGLVPWGSPRKVWLKALKAHDFMPNAPELGRRWEVAQGLSFEHLYEEWMRLVVETSLEDNRNGHHNFEVVSQLS